MDRNENQKSNEHANKKKDAPTFRIGAGRVGEARIIKPDKKED